MRQSIVDAFVDWCHTSCLQLNSKKTKEMIFDFRASRLTRQQVAINGNCIVVVNEYKYPGTVIHDKLSWYLNTGAIYKRGLQQLYFMQKLRQFGVDRFFLIVLFVESILNFCFMAWYFSLSS